MVQRPVGWLRPNPRNARSHSERQITQLAASIEAFGFTAPIVADEDGNILAGHGRLAAAEALGLEQVPVILLKDLTQEMKRLLALADNRLAELSGWDEPILVEELAELETLSLDLGFDLEIAGFDTVDLDQMLDRTPEENSSDPADGVVEPDVGPPVSRPGDVWLLGPHRLLCGNALDRAAYDYLMGGEKAALVVSDPPFNVPIEGHVSGKGRHRHGEFAMASGEMSPAAFTAFLEQAFRHEAAVSRDGAIHFQFMDWRHQREMLAAGSAVYSELKNLIVWDKGRGGMGTFYRSQHELIFAWKHGSAPHTNTFGLGERGRYRSNIWKYPGVNALTRSGKAALQAHPTVKPVAMIADAIRDCSHRGEIVLDPFAGSGTILLAAERTGRRARAMELDPKYVDVAVRRWQRVTGLEIRLEGDDRPFEVIAAERQAAPPEPGEVAVASTPSREG